MDRFFERNFPQQIIRDARRAVQTKVGVEDGAPEIEIRQQRIVAVQNGLRQSEIRRRKRFTLRGRGARDHYRMQRLESFQMIQARPQGTELLHRRLMRMSRIDQ